MTIGMTSISTGKFNISAGALLYFLICVLTRALLIKCVILWAVRLLPNFNLFWRELAVIIPFDAFIKSMAANHFSNGVCES